MAWQLPEKYRVAYLVYMSGATLKDVGEAVGLSVARVATMVQVCDRVLEAAARGSERLLWRQSPEVWYHRRLLGQHEDLPGARPWERIAEPPDRRAGDEVKRSEWREREKARRRRKMLRSTQLQISLKASCFAKHDAVAGAWVAWCPVLDLHSQGTTVLEAEDALRACLNTWSRLLADRGVLFATLKDRLDLRMAIPVDTSKDEPFSYSRSFDVELKLTFERSPTLVQ